MFNLNIVDDDVFLGMPISAQALYFHLGMRADDDGFVTPLKVMRMVGANADDLNILIAKRYVLPFTSGVVVLKHWPVQNRVKKDRYVPTTYQKELKELTLNEWGVYTERRGSLCQSKTVNSITTSNSSEDEENGQNGAQVEPQYSVVEYSLGNINTVSTNVETAKKSPMRYGNQKINAMFNLWEVQVGYPIQGRLQANRRACSNLLKKYDADEMEKLLGIVGVASKDKYAPRIADFTDLQSKFNELMLWAKKHLNASRIVTI